MSEEHSLDLDFSEFITPEPTNEAANTEEAPETTPEETPTGEVNTAEESPEFDYSKLQVDYDFGPEKIDEFVSTGEEILKKIYNVDDKHDDYEQFKPIIEEFNKKVEVIKQLHEKLDGIKNMDEVKVSIGKQQALTEFKAKQAEWANEFEEYFPEENKLLNSLKKADKEKTLTKFIRTAAQKYMESKLTGKPLKNPFISVKADILKEINGTTPKAKETLSNEQKQQLELDRRKKLASVKSNVVEAPTDAKSKEAFLNLIPKANRTGAAIMSESLSSLSEFL